MVTGSDALISSIYISKDTTVDFVLNYSEMRCIYTANAVLHSNSAMIKVFTNF